MPDLEISKLPGLSGAALEQNDPLPITDTSAATTKKITAKDLVQNGVLLIDDGSIPAEKVQGGGGGGGGAVDSVNGKTGNVVLDADDVGALASGDDISELNNDVGYITDAGVTKLVAGTNITLDPATGVGDVTIHAAGGGGGGGAVDSVNGKTGVVILTAADVGAVAPGDDVSDLNNDAGYITAADVPDAPVTSVNAKTGDVVLTASDVGALASGDNVSELVNDANYITLAQVPAAPVESVNGETGAVVLGLEDLDDVTISNVANGDIIAWSTDKWVNTAAPPADISGSSIGDLNDVTISGIADDDILVWDAAAGSFKPEAKPTAGGVTKLIAGDNIELDPADGLGEVEITAINAVTSVNGETGDVTIDAGQSFWQRTVSADVANQTIITPDELTDAVGFGSTNDAPEMRIIGDQYRIEYRTVGNFNKQALFSYEPDMLSEGGFLFKRNRSGLDQNNGQVILDPRGGVEITMSGAQQGIGLAGSNSQGWNTSGTYTAIDAKNFGDSTFTVDMMGLVSVRKSLTVGDVGTSGANIPGLIKCVGDSTQSGASTDKAVEVEFDGATTFSVSHAGKVTAAIFDLESLDPLT